MQPAGEVDHLIGIAFLGVAKHVFDDAASLDTRDHMFDPDANLRDEPIVGLVLWRELATTWFFLRLSDLHPFDLMAR
jgi:hypothetical protein